MSRELLDEHVPGWESMDRLPFRWTIGRVDARIRASLLLARDALMSAPVPVAISDEPEPSSQAPTPPEPDPELTPTTEGE